MSLNWDILIPAYNADKFIEATVASASLQRHSPSRIIACDDSSNDTTVTILLSLESVTTIRNSQNAGVGVTRQKLLSMADSEWILYLDADDQLLPQAAEILAEAVRKNPDAVVHAFGEVPNTAAPGAYAPPVTQPIVLPNPVEVTHRDLLARNPICSSATLIRRDAALLAGGFSTARRLIDYCMWFRIARNFPSGILLYTTPIVQRLISASTITGNVNAAVAEEARLLDREWGYSYSNSGLTSPLRRQLRLTTLWLRGLSRHTDYGKPGSEYLDPGDVRGLWPLVRVLGLIRSRPGLRAYGTCRWLIGLKTKLADSPRTTSGLSK